MKLTVFDWFKKIFSKQYAVPILGIVVLTLGAVLYGASQNSEQAKQISTQTTPSTLQESANKSSKPVIVRPSSPMLSPQPPSGLPVRPATAGTPQTVGLALGGSLQGWSQDKLNQTFKGIKSLGATSIRFDVAWSALQPNSVTKYNWRPYDNIITTAKKYGLTSLIILDYTPPWARMSKCKDTQMCPPANNVQFGTYAAAVVKRYTPQGVTSYEIWNEENSNQFWAPTANTTEYVSLLRETATAIKKVEPRSTILLGGMTPAGDPKEAIAPRDFLSQVYALGAKDSFDAVGYHPYTSPFLISQTNLATNWHLIDETNPNLHDIMKANGDEAKQIWLTEYGAPTNGSGEGAKNIVTTANYGYVSEDMQASMAKEAVAGLRTKPWVRSLYWYTYQDGSKTATDREAYFGLVGYNGVFKPSYYRLQESLKN